MPLDERVPFRPSWALLGAERSSPSAERVRQIMTTPHSNYHVTINADELHLDPQIVRRAQERLRQQTDTNTLAWMAGPSLAGIVLSPAHPIIEGHVPNEWEA